MLNLNINKFSFTHLRLFSVKRNLKKLFDFNPNNITILTLWMDFKKQTTISNKGGGYKSKIDLNFSWNIDLTNTFPTSWRRTFFFSPIVQEAIQIHQAISFEKWSQLFGLVQVQNLNSKEKVWTKAKHKNDIEPPTTKNFFTSFGIYLQFNGRV